MGDYIDFGSCPYLTRRMHDQFDLRITRRIEYMNGNADQRMILYCKPVGWSEHNRRLLFVIRGG